MRPNIFRFKMILLAAFLTGAFMIQRAVAATIVVPIETRAVISDTSGEARILLDFGDLEELTGKWVLYAKCRLELSLEGCEKASAEIEVRPLTRSWSAASATWQSPWESPGGDLSTDHRQLVDIPAAGGETEILMTELVQAWVNGEVANHGVLLRLPHERCGITLESASRLPGGGTYGQLLVKYVDKDR